MDLNEQIIPAIPGKIEYAGASNFIVTENTKFSIKNHNDKVLERSVPSGKQWRVTIKVHIIETNK